MALLEVEGLSIYFHSRNGVVKAVDNVSFSVDAGETLAIVGESGSGKSVTCYSLLDLLPKPPAKIEAGTALFDGIDLLSCDAAQMRRFRSNDIAMIFQDPMMTLNPVLRIDTQMIEAITAHEPVDHQTAWERCRDALGLVGIPSPEERLRAYPHQLSGGMRQRVAIATAFLNKPDLIIADEPTTALDVTIQAQIIHEAQNLTRRTGTAMIWITHDLAVVAGLADRISVMYAGRIVEQGGTDDIIDRPLHPYTVGLLGSVPSANKRGQRLFQIEGMAPNMLALPQGCAFAPRCQNVTDACAMEPSVEDHDGRSLRCFNPHSGGGRV